MTVSVLTSTGNNEFYCDCTLTHLILKYTHAFTMKKLERATGGKEAIDDERRRLKTSPPDPLQCWLLHPASHLGR